MMKDGMRDAAEHHPAQPVATTGPHHQEIGTDGFGLLENRLDRNA